MRYALAGTVNFKVNNTDITQRVCTVKVNDTEVGTSTGSYSFTLNPETDNVITVETMHTTDMEGIGTQDNPYKIMSAEHWNHIAREAEEGHLAAGQYFELGADIQVATMIGTEGTEGHYFSGHFDGKGHTLTVSYGSTESPLAADYAAPFCYFDGGSIKNLHIVGDIYTSAKFAAGIVASQSGTVAIENCRNSVAIHSSKDGDGSHGGLVGIINNGSTTIEGCLFYGKLLGSNTSNCGGFVGWTEGNNSASVTIKKSLFIPETITIGTNDCATFSRGRDGHTKNITVTNCYYSETFGTKQGNEAYYTETKPANIGEEGTFLCGY
jgi:hypothetical protein